VAVFGWVVYAFAVTRLSVLLVALAFGLACGDPHLGSLLGAQIESAELNVAIDNISLVGGHVLGEGSVVVTHVDGLQEGLPMRMEGGSAGASMNFSTTFSGRLPYIFEEESVAGEDLLGYFEGVVIGGEMLIGAHHRNFRNDAGVEFKGLQAAGGVGVHLAVEWVLIELKEGS
jgi:hypothetical protein